MKIEEYNPDKPSYYVSPANSLCFIDSGIDYSLSRIIFPGIENMVKSKLTKYGKRNLFGRQYLPIGSSIIIPYDENRNLVVAPTMLLPQNVSKTNNAYYATMAVLYNVLMNNQNISFDSVDILLTSMCCGFGIMDVDTSINQILRAICDYKMYKPSFLCRNVLIS